MVETFIEQMVGHSFRRPGIALCACWVTCVVGTPAPGQGGRDANVAAEKILEAASVKGGLVVQIGCGNGDVTVALGGRAGVVVHALDRDAAKVERTRQRIREAGLYGKVTAELWPGKTLPYVDNLVNLLVCSEAANVSEEEILRVLAPGGAVCTRHDDTWAVTRKPWPEEIDEWTHSFYDASNNAVSRDMVVAPPYHAQWIAGPLNTRSHEHASVSTVVSASGRVFYIVDEAPAASVSLPSQWFLIARDAFSGILLWRLPIPQWDAHPAGIYRGPPEISRRLVAVGDRVYVTLGTEAAVSMLDAATGRALMAYEGTEGTGEILFHDGRLYLAAAGPVAHGSVRREPMPLAGSAITALDSTTGQVLWKKAEGGALSGTLAVHSGRVFYVAPEAIVCLDASTGDVVWQTPHPGPERRYVWRAPTLVVSGDVVLCADRRSTSSPDVDEATGQKMARWLANAGAPGDLIAYSAGTGQELWRTKCAESYYTPVDVFVRDGLVWVGQSRSRQGPDYAAGRDLHTGEVKHRIDVGQAFQTTMPHHRCHRDRATERFLVVGRTGVEFIDFDTGETSRHHWTRGVCRFGVVPGNGLLYVPPHSCACFIEAKLTGFNALAPIAPHRLPPEEIREEDRLDRGASYGSAVASKGGTQGNQRSAVPAGSDWPTYRHDPARSGATASGVPSRLLQLWDCDLGGRLSSPVVAEGRLLVASIDTHTIHALDALTGKSFWAYTAGGRVDSPPTIADGLAVFGSADGWVHCLRADSGELVWRYRVAPIDQRMTAFGQLESVWPVHGSVLVQDGVVTCAAGRSSYLDSGIYLVRLDLKTGRQLAQRRVYSRDQATGAQPGEPIMFEMPGALPDILSSDAGLVYMRHLAFDPDELQDREAKPHLFSPAGFLNDDWWHRTYWIYGTHYYCGYIGWRFAGFETPAGRLLALNDTSVFGFARRSSLARGAGAQAYEFFALDRASLPAPEPPDYTRAGRPYNRSRRGPRELKVSFRWTSEAPILARALVCAGDKLCVAGLPKDALRSASVFAGKHGGGLCLVAVSDGQVLQDCRIDSPPVLDGVAVAGGRVFISCQDGRVRCFGDGTSAAGARELPPLKRQRRQIVAGPAKEPGLIGHWELNEADGVVALDSSGLQYDGEIKGRRIKGTFGRCVSTEGIAGAVTIPDNDLLHFGTASFSFALWVKPDTLDCRLLGKDVFPETWWVINVLEDGKLELVLAGPKRKGRIPLRATTTATVSTKSWTHLAYVVDRDHAKVQCYLNGALDSETPIPTSFRGSLSVEGKDLLIPTAFRPFSGLLDELRIYRRTLGPEEIRSRYNDEVKDRADTAFEYVE